MGNQRSAGDRTLRIGAVITAVGLVFAAIALLPLLVSGVELPGFMWFLAMITGVGLIVVFIGLLRGARQRRSRR